MADITLADRRPVDPTPIVQLKVMDQNDDLAPDGKGESSKKGGLRRPDSSHGGMSYMQSESVSGHRTGQ